MKSKHSLELSPAGRSEAAHLTTHELKERQREIWGGRPEVTSNQMQLFAAVRALSRLKDGRVVTVRSGSEYLIDGVRSGLRSWKASGWRSALGRPVENAELWRELDLVVRRHDVTWEWVRDYPDDGFSERADELARVGAKAAKQGIIRQHKRLVA